MIITFTTGAADALIRPIYMIFLQDTITRDLEMLAWAGRSVAMANARDEVRAAADHVTSSVEDDGVAVFVEDLFAGEG